MTSPVVRMLKQQVPNAEVHFLTKKSFDSVVVNNPFIDKVWTTDGSLKDVIPNLKAEKFDEIIDLHANLRTWRIKQSLKVKSSTFNKLNFEKWLLVNFKINRLPATHIVNRYLKTVEHLGVMNDGEGLNFYLDNSIQSNNQILPSNFQSGYWVAVIEANHATKRFPTNKWIEVVKQINFPVVIVGDKNDAIVASEIENAYGVTGVGRLGALLAIGVTQHAANRLGETNLGAWVQEVLARQDGVWAKLTEILGGYNLLGNETDVGIGRGLTNLKATA